MSPTSFFFFPGAQQTKTSASHWQQDISREPTEIISFEEMLQSQCTNMQNGNRSCGEFGGRVGG